MSTLEGTFYLCHPDDLSHPDCYTLFQGEWASEHYALPQRFVIGGVLA